MIIEQQLKSFFFFLTMVNKSVLRIQILKSHSKQYCGG